MRRELIAANRMQSRHSDYCDGAWHEALNALYRADLVFGGIVNGRFMSTHRYRLDYYEKAGIGAKDWHDSAKRKGHYWADSLKPYFTDQE
jgi:hypothetical protein